MSDETTKASLSTMDALMGDLVKMLTPKAPMTMPEEWIKEGEHYDSLGPNYFAGRQIAAAFMEKFQGEHFTPLVDEFVKQFKEKMWEQVQDYLIDDIENGLQQAIWYQIDRSVEGLLSGETWAVNKYVLGGRHDCEKIRAAIAKHIPVELQDKRIADLEEQLDNAKKDLQFARGRY